MIETLDYGAFSLTVHQEVNGRRIPVNGTIELTHRCPLECVHCYNNLPMSARGVRAAPAVRHRHHALRPHEGALRGAARHSRLVRALPARDPASPGAKAAAEVENRRDLDEQA